MLQAGEDLALHAERKFHLGAGVLKAKQLDGYELAEGVVGAGCTIDRAHSTMAERVDQFVWTHAAADERRERWSVAGQRRSDTIQEIGSALVRPQRVFSTSVRISPACSESQPARLLGLDLESFLEKPSHVGDLPRVTWNCT